MAEIRKVEKMAKKEVETITCDPFRVRLSFSLAEKLKSALPPEFVPHYNAAPSQHLPVVMGRPGWHVVRIDQGC